MAGAGDSYTYDELVDLLRQLDDQLELMDYHGKFAIHPVGGFAMLHHGMRQDSPFTKDIDCASPEFPPAVKKALDIVSDENGISPHWLNNDTVMSFDEENLGVVTPEDVAIANMMMHAEYLPDSLGLKHLDVRIATVDTLAYGKAAAACDVVAVERGMKDVDDLFEVFDHEGVTTFMQAVERFPELTDPEFDLLPDVMSGMSRRDAPESERMAERAGIADDMLASFDDIDTEHIDDMPSDPFADPFDSEPFSDSFPSDSFNWDDDWF